MRARARDRRRDKENIRQALSTTTLECGSLTIPSGCRGALPHTAATQMSFARSLSQVTELKGVLKMCQTMHAAMSHFVNQIQYYFVFEVLECSWHELLKAVETAEDLDQLIKASQTTKEALSSSTSNDGSKTKPGLFRVWMVCSARPQI